MELNCRECPNRLTCITRYGHHRPSIIVNPERSTSRFDYENCLFWQRFCTEDEEIKWMKILEAVGSFYW